MKSTIFFCLLAATCVALAFFGLGVLVQSDWSSTQFTTPAVIVGTALAMLGIVFSSLTLWCLHREGL